MVNLETISNVLDIKSLNDDISKCQNYIEKIKSGDLRCVNEAYKYSFEKYKDYIKKDVIITSLNTDYIDRNRDIVSQTLINLDAIQKMAKQMITTKENKD